MLYSDRIKHWNGNFLTGVVVGKSQLFLHPFGFDIAYIISTPYGNHRQFLESTAQQFLSCLRNVAMSPIVLADPVAQLAFIFPAGHIAVAMEL